jgi:hypothetical protein
MGKVLPDRFRGGAGLAGLDELPNQAGEPGRFTAQVAQPRSLRHFLGSCRSPVDVVAGLRPESCE